jgi:ferredoxin
MGWDYRDELWFGRRQATTLVSLACGGVDDACFCGTVGLSPASTKGADLMLHPGEGGYLAEVVTEKGASLVDTHGPRFSETSAEPTPVEASTDPEAVRAWLAGNFEHPLWDSIALGCHGCGACAAVCPSCHCFDIVDEPEGVLEGTRRRNWDTCQTARFTAHASGHNPRARQSARFRQRVMHKFSIYPAKFGETLCTGCGRCARACPAGIDLPEVLSKIATLAAEAVP